MRDSSDTETRVGVAAALAVGLFHAVFLYAVALYLGYGAVLPDLPSLVLRYVGVVCATAVTVSTLLRYSLYTPTVSMATATAYVVAAELTPPRPSFVDVADLERLPYPTGITVVENGLYIVNYVDDAPVWLLGFLLFGVIEYSVREMSEALPDVVGIEVSVPSTHRKAVLGASAVGLAHAAVMTWFAYPNVTMTGVPVLLFYIYGFVGMWLLAAVPVYLLLTRSLIGSVSLLAVLVILNARGNLRASIEDPQALYFGGWFFFLGVLLVAATIEYVLRFTVERHL